ncbi:MAG: DUF1002 domain-containing protein [Actinomycetia bacterium]|nr:DUF1002 domain-containing protein [Actinomycetes bacterium]
MHRRLWALVAALWMVAVVPATALAANPVVTLGKDLTPAERQEMLRYFGVRGRTMRLYIISNAQEHQLLGGVAPAEEIGTRAISCAYVVPERHGAGIRVTTHDITWVTPAMYANALATAGVADAAVSVAAPYPVSGTAALAGILWAYQASTGVSLSPARKTAAAQELVATADLARRTGRPDAAATLVRVVKQEVLSGRATSPEAIRAAVIRTAASLHLSLTAGEVDDLVTFLLRLRGLGISAATVHQQLARLGSESGQAAGFWAWLVGLWHWIWGLVTGRLSAVG